MQVTKSGKLPVKAWVKDIGDIEPQAMEQAYRISRLPFIHKHVALMPDTHRGKGACVGSVIASKGAVVPALVGVDIGCGMLAARLNLTADELPDDLSTIRHEIEARVPVGQKSNSTLDNYEKAPMDVSKLRVWDNLNDRTRNRMAYQVGSLGGGNHFLELCLDENNDVWIMLHSGSRNIGKEVADMHINGAKDLMKKMFINLEDPELAYFAKGTQEYQDYINDVFWCQQYAANNRDMMFENALSAVKKCFNKDVKLVNNVTSCHHNYVDVENHYGKNVIVTRKGAIRAREGDVGIIPGSMGTRSYIVKGLGNAESFCSCSHGAGRKMSRSKARKTFTVEDLKQQTECVECRKDSGAIDEIPGAYKDIDEVMDNQKDLVEVLHTLKQVMCIKG